MCILVYFQINLTLIKIFVLLVRLCLLFLRRHQRWRSTLIHDSCAEAARCSGWTRWQARNTKCAASLSHVCCCHLSQSCFFFFFSAACCCRAAGSCLCCNSFFFVFIACCIYCLRLFLLNWETCWFSALSSFHTPLFSRYIRALMSPLQSRPHLSNSH